MKNTNRTGLSAVYNFIGFGVPLIAAVFSVPLLIEKLGVDRFGLLTLIWAMVSYFGVFDLGLGRALTMQLSVYVDRGEVAPAKNLTVTTITFLILVGVVGGGVLALLGPRIISSMDTSVSPNEIYSSMVAMAVCVPFIVVTAGLRGILEAHHEFGIINLLRAPLGVYTFIGPLFAAVFVGKGLETLAWFLVAGRMLSAVAYGYYSIKCLNFLDNNSRINFQSLFELLRTGGWITVSNVVSPLMGYVDRFLVGVILSSSAVAYYATPNELITKVWIIPAALTAVLFPRFAAGFASDPDKISALFIKSITWLLAIIFPISLFVLLFSGNILSIWISPDFAGQSSPVLRIFAIGILLNSMAHVPYTLIQGSGNARVTALTHLIELPLFVLLLWLLTSNFGLVGAAYAWLIRVVVDSVVLFVIAFQYLSISLIPSGSRFFVATFLAMMIGFMGLYSDETGVKLSFYMISIVAVAYFLLGKQFCVNRAHLFGKALWK